MSTTKSKTKPRRARKRTVLGEYIVADPAICYGKPTFIGSRVMVWQILEQVSEEMPWDKIVGEWNGSVSKEAIAETVKLARRTFDAHAIDYEMENEPA